MRQEQSIRSHYSKHGTSRKRLVIAFIAGMLVTATLALTPVAAAALAQEPGNVPGSPALPAKPKNHMEITTRYEMVFNVFVRCTAG